MRHDISSVIMACVCSFVLGIAALPMTVYSEDCAMPHLIQTVTEQDVYEGMLALGLLETPVLATDNCEKAYENVVPCVVGINMGNAHGSGMVWEMTSEGIIIVTNKHVLEYWDELISYVQFPQGYFADAHIIGISKEHDVGFLMVDSGELDYGELETLRYVRKDMEAYGKTKAGDEMFCVGSESGTNIYGKPIMEGGENFYKGSIGDMDRYIDEFGEYMIYALGYGKPGMSGGGTFDAKGNLIGMISGGTADGETASVPLPVMMEAYEVIVGDAAGN